MKISELHKTWNSGGPTYLTDNELCILINELVKMREYFRDMGEKIITYYHTRDTLNATFCYV